MTNLNGKTVIITGAKGGLGTSVTRAFLDAGANVCGVSRSIAAADFPHARFTAMPAELGSREAADLLIERAGRVDALVHLMGGWSGGARVEDTDTATFDRMFELNVRSAFFVLSAAARAMRRQGSGRILAIAGKAAAVPQAESVAYSASKAALVSLVQGLAAELEGTGITANAVLPGTMDTPQNRAGSPNADPSRWVQPAHVAELLVYLASAAGASVTGAAIPIYGAAA